MIDLPPAQEKEGTPLLRAVNLRKHYLRGGAWAGNPLRVDSLQGVDLQVLAGAALALIGSSGSGKSTLARCLAGLEKPDSGEIWWGGEKFQWMGNAATRGAKARVQLVFQDTGLSLNPRFSAIDVVSEPLLVAEWGSKSQRRERASELMRSVGLPPEFADKRPSELSGGQRRRLAIARALTLEPRLLILDEALAGLDLSTQAQIANLLLDLQQARGFAYLWISHDLQMVARLAEQVAVMDEGRIVEAGPTRAFFASPVSAQGRSLLAASHAWQVGRP